MPCQWLLLGNYFPGGLLMHIVIEVPLPCMGPCIVVVQQPHSKSLSECRYTGLMEMVSVWCWSEMFQKFMGGFDCEESVIKGRVVCCSAVNDLLFHYNPEFFQVGYALVKSLNPGTQFDQNWKTKTFHLFTIQWIFKVKEGQSTVIIGHFLNQNN